ncbi:triphosphoribosyl-dephospho-CoA synthase [Streptomyces sp. NPDC056503]|uniref:triphosphoribosyl-dephospho-CoA synthase n=1 Tax=Streptomyces sp. NPDC056503 TaxID=3345842 RepID=UPI00368E5AD0
MTIRADEEQGRRAVAALLALVGQAGGDAADPAAARWSARALEPGFTAMAAAARRTGEPSRALRAELGAIGRAAERTMARADGGASLHHGAVWPLGLLVAGTALAPGGGPEEAARLAGQLARHPDPGAPRRPSPGSAMSQRYGAAGAKGEARAGFPHVRMALRALAKARADGAREPEARLTALLTVMASLRDTGPLHTAGPAGLREVQDGALAVLAGTLAPAVLDARLRARGLRPRGSGHVLAAALFLEDSDSSFM